MKKIILTITIFFFIPFVFVWASPLDSLHQYYEADKNEDIEKIISLTDFSSVDPSDLEEFMQETRIALETLAEIFNTEYYQISDESIITDEDNAIVYYRLKTEITDNLGDSLVIDEDFVAVMRKSDIWRVVYTQPKDVFEKNMIAREATIALGESYAEKVDFSDFPLEKLGDDAIGEKKEDRKGFSLGIIVILILIAALVTFFVIKKKNKNL